MKALSNRNSAMPNPRNKDDGHVKGTARIPSRKRLWNGNGSRSVIVRIQGHGQRSARRLIRADRLAASTESRLQTVGCSAKHRVQECFGSACAVTSQVTG
jgi:hypothetical protein